MPRNMHAIFNMGCGWWSGWGRIGLRWWTWFSHNTKGAYLRNHPGQEWAIQAVSGGKKPQHIGIGQVGGGSSTCWGKLLQSRILHILPRCEISLKFRYDMRMASFRRHPGLHIYSRESERTPWRLNTIYSEYGNRQLSIFFWRLQRLVDRLQTKCVNAAVQNT